MKKTVLMLWLCSLPSVFAQKQSVYTSMQYDSGTASALPGSCTQPAFYHATDSNVAYVCSKAGHFVATGVPFVSAQNAGTDVICALHADTITGLTCNNQVTDGTTETAFSSSVTIPAGTLANKTIMVYLGFGLASSGGSVTATVKIKLNGTAIYSSTSNVLTFSAGNYRTTALEGGLTAAGGVSTTTPVFYSEHGNGTVSPSFQGSNQLGTSGNLGATAIDTTVDQVMTVTVTFNAATAANAVYLYSIKGVS